GAVRLFVRRGLGPVPPPGAGGPAAGAPCADPPAAGRRAAEGRLLPGHGAVRVGFSAVPFVQHQPVRLRLVRPAPPPSGRRSALRPLPAPRGGGPALPVLAGTARVKRHEPALQHRPHHAGAVPGAAAGGGLPPRRPPPAQGMRRLWPGPAGRRPGQPPVRYQFHVPARLLRQRRPRPDRAGLWYRPGLPGRAGPDRLRRLGGAVRAVGPRRPAEKRKTIDLKNGPFCCMRTAEGAVSRLKPPRGARPQGAGGTSMGGGWDSIKTMRGPAFTAAPRRGTLSFVAQKFFCFGAINNRRNYWLGTSPLSSQEKGGARLVGVSKPASLL